MKIVLIQTGKTQDSYIAEGITQYSRRLSNYTGFDIVTINVPKAGKQGNVTENRKTESALVLAKISDSDFVVLLDERGKELDSIGFSAFIAQRLNTSVKKLVFVIGGAYGFSD